MSKFLRIGFLFFALVLMASPAMAQEPNGSFGSGAFGAGLAVLGGAYGIGKLGAAAVESMARQPSVAPRAQTAMIIAAAMIEGATLFAIIVCMGQNPWAGQG